MDKSLQTALAVIVGIASYLALTQLGWSAETKIAVAVSIAISIIGFPIGLLAGRYLAKGRDIDRPAYVAFAIAGLSGAILPILGMAISAVVWQFHKRSENHRLLYSALSSAIGLLAVGNAAWGAAMNASSAV